MRKTVQRMFFPFSETAFATISDFRRPHPAKRFNSPGKGPWKDATLFPTWLWVERELESCAVIEGLGWHDCFFQAHGRRSLAYRLGPIQAHFRNEHRDGGVAGKKYKSSQANLRWRETGCGVLILDRTPVGERMLENKRERLKTFLRKIDEKAIFKIKHFMKER